MTNFISVSASRLSLDVLLALRVLRLLRVIRRVKRFKIVIDTINKILPSLFSYGSVILIVYYVFAIIGIEIFSGKIQYLGYDTENFCGNDKLNGSDFWMEKYCNNNFNDLIHAFIVLFELTVVNHLLIAYGFAAVTNPAARLYFMIFHLTCVIVVLNIFTAFVLEAFILEYFARQSDLETEVERKIHEIGLSTRSEKIRRRSMAMNFQDLMIDEADLDSSDEDEDNKSIMEMKAMKFGNNNRRESTYADRSMDTQVRFVISKKVKSVEVLLQKMFEKELSDELGEEELHKWVSEEKFAKRRESVWEM
ncbi:Two pore calcium channel protein 1 [Armadillidium vulgare]|nr:Two pore calcium channel protein 1 [Armadillidium vulgare]